ncbi:MAG: bifunctional diaminohydroxyphosphoribosylaminopyrimidine deaminase/5-amino-6-(5-phosphoribosylamino)uracil reductase RibD [Ferruginibacter sp.]
MHKHNSFFDAYFCPLLNHDIYMQRCLWLAALGAGYTAPNPLVGAVLVYRDRIIGEGYHRKYGEAHAEVNCISSVKAADQPLIAQSRLYVSLEPCSHYGKTPPCTGLILSQKIPEVIIATTDPFAAVNGSGIARLRQAGVRVITGILEKEAQWQNRRFFTFQQLQRPYVILKWAQTADGYTGNRDTTRRLLISDAISNRLVHRWRSEEAAILVGTNTALADNPRLTNRLWTGPQPLRMVTDLSLRLPGNLHLFDKTIPTVIFNNLKEEREENLQYVKIAPGLAVLPAILEWSYQNGVQSILVEGGARLLQSFINIDCWDEARVITNPRLRTEEGIAAPQLGATVKAVTLQPGGDNIDIYFKQH